MRPIPAGVFFLVLVCALSPSIPGQSKKASQQILATVGGVAITEAQVRENGAEDLEMFELQTLKAKAVSARTEQEILEKHLSLLIEEKLLEAESARRGVTKQDLLASEVQSKVQEPTAEDIDSFYQTNAERINQPKEQVEVQIRNYLKRREASYLRNALLKRLESEHPVRRSVKPLRFEVAAAGRPSWGPASAPVVVVVFSDFECPYCKEYSSTIKGLKEKYGDKVRLVFRQFPLTSIHPNAQKAAEASLCAANQNKFWEMHDLLFEDQSLLGVEDLKSSAKKLGLNVVAFNACLDGGRSAPLVRADLAAAFGAGADGAPSTFVNGRYINGSVPAEMIVPMIEEELALRTAPSKQPPSSPARK